MEDKQAKKARWVIITLKILLPVLFFGYMFAISMNYSLNDPDLWWHLKTGQYILNNWEVPDEDPFAYTTPRPLGEGQKIGLRGHWLSQIIFFVTYTIGSYKGIVILRNVLTILPMLFLYLWLIEKGVKPWTAIVVSSFSSLMFSIQLFYSFERSQGIAFGLSIVVAIILDRLRQHAKHGHEGNLARFDLSYWMLPLIMALWSNIHASFIIGNGMIMIYMFSEALVVLYRKLRGKGQEAPYIKALFIVGGISVIASFLNPNKYKIFLNYFFGMVSMFFKEVSQKIGGGEGAAGGWVTDVVLEFKPLIYFYHELGYKWLLFYWAFSGLLIVLLIFKYWQKRSVDIAELLTVGVVTFFANYYARGLMFSLAILPFYMGKSLTEINLPQIKFKVAFRAVVILILTLSIGFSTYSYKASPSVFKPGITSSWVSPWYPGRLVEFLHATQIEGPMYNFYTWGGFLIWTLYPKYKVFIDGRALDDVVNRTADAILKTFPGWQEKLDAYGINFIVVPVIFRESGHIIPIAVELVNNDRWKLVFIKNNSTVFVRNIPKNEKVIKSFGIDKKYIYSHIIEVEGIFLSSSPNNPVFNLAMADALFGLGRYREAKAIYERFPQESSHKLQELKALGY
ncbi:MAG: tetratricopeptide repeat protein [Nitrospirae bacterium]|nr:tetratricopeptide repeat protein [Nitrospirota bacterium]